MGAGQSSGSSDAPNDQQVKTSYYELLKVERHATDDEIKKAYRRKALELHPDRNYGNEEEATRTFAEVQAAYEILSDPQERAWYDSHESAILRGDDGTQEEVHTYQNVRVTTADDLARVLRKFNSNVEFSDAPSGFFGFLNEQFEHLAKEEEIAAAWDNVETREYPPFGHKDDTHDDVVKKFYATWTNFSTIKTFSWKDKYRLSEALDRRVRRLMEKENSNLRQEAIREFNDAVRAFVLFVRKRDPRYTPSTQSEEERQRVLRDATAAQAARARAANQAAAQGEVPAWAQFREPEELEESSEEEVEQEVIECVACNKTFKSERQYEAHEKSKKHQKAIAALQRQMRKDNKNLDLNSQQVNGAVDEADWDIIGDDTGSDVSHIDDTVSLESVSDEQQQFDVDHTRAIAIDTQDMASDEHDRNNDNDHDDDTAATKPVNSSTDELATDLDKTALHDLPSDGSDQDSAQPTKKLGKAAQKRAKKAAASAVAQESANTHKCAGCDATFPSRTRLFQHIKDHGHAALKSASGPTSKSKKGKGKK